MNAEVVPALASLTDHLGDKVGSYSNIKDVPETQVSEFRNDMYLSTTAFKRLDKAEALPAMSEAQEKPSTNTVTIWIHSCNTFRPG